MMITWLIKAGYSITKKMLRKHKVFRVFPECRISSFSLSFNNINYIGSLKSISVHLCSVSMFLHFNGLDNLLKSKN